MRIMRSNGVSHTPPPPPPRPLPPCTHNHKHTQGKASKDNDRNASSQRTLEGENIPEETNTRKRASGEFIFFLVQLAAVEVTTDAYMSVGRDQPDNVAKK